MLAEENKGAEEEELCWEGTGGACEGEGEDEDVIAARGSEKSNR